MTAKWLAPMLAALALAGSATAQVPPAPNDYRDPANWLCRPGRPDDVCGRSQQDATVLQADGSTRIERFHPDPDPPIDCFYVYPTVSLDPGGNATMRIAPQEVKVVDQQFARFASVCRTFAPVYRQVTLTALRDGLAGHPISTDRQLAYDDVKAAWNDYLAHDNHGRGVVLIGHSQGSAVLTELVKHEIDGKPVQKRLLSVILAGYLLQVPKGEEVGGDFKSIPLCRRNGQTQCAMNFADFRADSPPPSNSRFGASKGSGLEAACTDPGALAGGEAPMHAYMAAGAGALIADGVAPGTWTNPPEPITTPFVELPDLISGECLRSEAHSYLAVTLHPDPAGKRTNVIVGDVVIGGQVQKDWGLHLIDMNLNMGDLIDRVREQGRTYLAAQR